MAHKKTAYPLLIIIFFIFLEVRTSVGDSSDAMEALLKFKDSLQSNEALASWNKSSPPCSDGGKTNWIGVLCNKGKIWGLKLENMGLKGSIDVGLLKDLPDLRSISFMNNNFDGSWPDVNSLGALKALYLSYNRFSDDISGDAFSNMLSLKKVHLAHNQFSGVVPWSLMDLPKLLELRIEENQFSGKIPNFQQKTFKSFNVSHNALLGLIPPALSNLDPTSFSGNQGLCGKPLSPCDTSKKPSVLSTVVVSIVLAVAVLTIAAVIFIVNRRNQPSLSIEAPPHNLQKKSGSRELAEQAGQGSPAHSSGSGSGSGKKTENMKLSFVREDRDKFDLQDLLRASAEILGSGNFGSTYKAALLSGPMMVVKRFKQMNNVGKEEFHQHMKIIGRLRHPNLLPLVAFYYKKEEKLLISDYIHKGSLALHLHGQGGSKGNGLDWGARLKIVKGIANGLHYLYNEIPSLISPHGHLKSSNVLLTDSFQPLLTDYALIPVINQEHAQEFMVAYKSPEYTQHGRITKKTDVWGLGLLILEILTGKSESNTVQQEKGSEKEEEEDVISWVKSMGQEEWRKKVFDKEMGGAKNCEGEMIKLMKIGLSCCEVEVEKRWDLKEAVEKIEELKEKHGDDDFYSSYASEAETRSSRGLSDELSFSLNA